MDSIPRQSEQDKAKDGQPIKAAGRRRSLRDTRESTEWSP